MEIVRITPQYRWYTSDECENNIQKSRETKPEPWLQVQEEEELQHKVARVAAVVVVAIQKYHCLIARQRV